MLICVKQKYELPKGKQQKHTKKNDYLQIKFNNNEIMIRFSSISLSGWGRGAFTRLSSESEE